MAQTPCYNHVIYFSVACRNGQDEFKVILRLDSGDGLYDGEEERFFNTSDEADQFKDDICHIKTMSPQNARDQFTGMTG